MIDNAPNKEDDIYKPRTMNCRMKGLLGNGLKLVKEMMDSGMKQKNKIKILGCGIKSRAILY
jgi:hypothetical protein